MHIKRELLLVATLLGCTQAYSSGKQTDTYKIAFGSCAQETIDQPIWSAIQSAQPDLFLFTGDNIYADTENMQIMWRKYQQLDARPNFREFRNMTPILATWDDHDYGRNDAGNEYPMKKEAQQLFLDFLRVEKDSPRRLREGVYHSELIEWQDLKIQIILLDTRYHRTPLKRNAFGRYEANLDPEASILGANQWQWLQEQLLSPADLRVIVTSIQFIAEEHRFEKWSNFPKERKKMFDLIRQTKANGVLFVSGDRHHAEISAKQVDGIPYMLYDITASGLTNSLQAGIKNEANRFRLKGSDALTTRNFGTIELLSDDEYPDMLIRIHDGSGKTLIEQQISLNELQFAR